MDYLLSGSGEGNLSLQDMIECDMKTEFDEPLGNGNLDSMTMRNGLESPPLGLDTDSLSPGRLHDRNGLDRYGSLSHDVDISLTKDAKPDPSWLQSVSLSTNVLQNDNVSEVFQMVNPQTGLPVQLQTVVSLGQLTRTASPAQQSTIQYVTATLPHTPTPITTTSSGNNTTATLHRQLKNGVISTTPNTQLHSLHNSKLITQALSSGTAVTLSSVSYQQLLQQSPRTSSLVTQQLLNSNNNHLKQVHKVDNDSGKVFPKPVYSYSCLIAMALKNSETGALPVSEIYSFMTENFPYFKTAPDGWKNSVRHNLSLNKCFEKIENPKATGSTRKGCLWGLNPAKIGKMDEEIAKWRKKDLEAIQRSMAKPELLEKLERGNLDNQTQRQLLNNLNSQDRDVGRDSPTLINNNLVSVAAAAPTMTTKPIIGDIQLSMIEIKPAENGIGHIPVKVKVEPIFTIKPESVDASGAVGCSLTAEDLSVLDSSLSLDPSLGDSGLQNSVWEELGAEGISIDDIPFLFGQNTSSPLTVQTAKTGLSSTSAKSPMVSLLTTNHTANGASGSHTVVTSSSLSHRIYAQT